MDIRIFAHSFLLCLITMTYPLRVHSETLTLADAERIAAQRDSLASVYSSRSEAAREMAISAQQLTDPKLRLGALSLPVDSFRFDQEPMTQFQIGIQQSFSRGDTRKIAGQRYESLGSVQDALMADRYRKTLLEVRQIYVEAVLHQRIGSVLQESEAVLHEIGELVSDYHATGRSSQEEVLNARLELSRVEDRVIASQQRVEEVRAQLARLIGAPAQRTISNQWPELVYRADPAIKADPIDQHPQVAAVTAKIEYAQYTEQLAEQQYKPAYTLDFGYGIRSGADPARGDRSDLISVVLTMDLPFFRQKRQDRVLAARIAETQAAMHKRDDIYRRLGSEIEQQEVALRRVQQRLALYRDDLLPQASDHSTAAMDSYSDATGSLVDLLRAWNIEYELRIDQARLEAEALQLNAALIYLAGGETS